MKNKIRDYIKENRIDITDDNYIRWIYINGTKTKYMVTNDGSIISIRKHSSKKLKPFIDKDGYAAVVIYLNGISNYRRINRLVAEAFIENDDPEHKTQVNHINGKNKLDNSVSNLEWCTPKENIDHAWKNKLAKAKFGDKHPNTKYNNMIVKRICIEFVKNELSMREISEKFSVPYTIVKQIKNHIIHNDISKHYDFSHYNIDSRKRKRKIQ